MDSTTGSDRDPEVQRLLEQALVDQRSNWSRGERIPVEFYLAREPALGEDSEAILDLIYQEYVLRREHDGTCDPGEFCARFPELADSLLLQFGVDAALRSTERTETGGERSKDEAGVPVPSIAGFEILSLLGRGGMGVVYLARDLKLGRMVAIKMIAEGWSAAVERLERFRAEARAVARLRHPNIIAIHEIGEHEGRPYFTLEFAEGGSLAQRLAEKPLAPRAAAELLETLARAMDSAHQAGVVHRDLKPSNILLTAEGIPKVSDFGLAKLLDAGSECTASGQVMGTPSYMSPEQAEGRSKQVGPASDVHALGAILYQALTGRPPYLGESTLETLKLVVSADVVGPRRLRPEIPRDLETICLKCLEKEPLRRYSSALTMADDLRRFLDDRPITARPVGLAGRFRRWGRRNPWVAGLSAAVFASLLVGTGVSAALAIRAVRAEAATRKQRDRAETEAANAKAVNEFLRVDLLSQASAYNQVGTGGAPDPDLKVRTALDRAAAKIGGRFADQPLQEASIRLTIGETYHQLGLYKDALAHLNRALDLRKGILGPDDPETLLIMKSIGGVYLADGRLSEAAPLVLGAMEGLRKALGADHVDSLDATSLAAQLDYHQWKLPEAARLLEQVRAAHLQARGQDDVKVVEATNDLALVYLEQGKLEQAERMLAETVERARGTFGAEQYATLTACQSLACVKERLGKNDEAKRLLIEVITANSKVAGPKHPDTIRAMVRLAMIYNKESDFEKAEPLLTEALAGSRMMLDRNHEVAAAALAGLSVVYAGRRDVMRLGPVLIEAARIARVNYGLDDLTSAAEEAVGIFFLVQHEYDKAATRFRDSLTCRVKLEPSGDKRFLCELFLGASLLAQKEYTEAETHFLIGYNGLGRRNAPPLEKADLGWLVERVYQIRGADGRTLGETTFLSALRRDPVLQAVVLDLQFPAQPFAPP